MKLGNRQLTIATTFLASFALCALVFVGGHALSGKSETNPSQGNTTTTRTNNPDGSTTVTTTTTYSDGSTTTTTTYDKEGHDSGTTRVDKQTKDGETTTTTTTYDGKGHETGKTIERVDKDGNKTINIIDPATGGVKSTTTVPAEKPKPEAPKAVGPASAQQNPTYRMVAPDLAAQGEEITGMVVEDTDKGEVPLNEGDEVVFQGTVVPVSPGGKIKLPGFLKEVGNQFLVLQITRRAQGTPAKTATVSQHIEVLPVRQAGQVVATVVAQASQITTPGQPLQVMGQGLDKLQKASLVGQDGVEHQLGESVGSSLQRIYPGPKDLPNGNYQFVAQDANGQRYQAPNQCTNPTVQITGTQIRRRGQRGQFTVSCNIEADIMLSGGGPQIQLDTNTVHVTPQAPGKVGFTAIQVGDYTIKTRILNREDVPPDPQAPRVDAKPEPAQARYDPSLNQTNVSCPVNVVDQNGRPVPNVPVDVAATHPNGVVYQRVNTDNRGRANFLHAFAGQLAGNAVAVQAYRVLGRAWNKQPQPPQKPQPPGERVPEERPTPMPSPSPAGPTPTPTPTPTPSPSPCCSVSPHTYTVTYLGTLPPPGPANVSIAVGINDSEDTVGGSYNVKFTGAPHAFSIYPADAPLVAKNDLGWPPDKTPYGTGGDGAFAYGVNASGHVAGIWYIPPAPLAFTYPFWFDGKMHKLPEPGFPAGSGFAYALNIHDDVVGIIYSGESGSPLLSGHAVIWPHDSHPMVDLNTLLPKGSGWELKAAYGINDAGHIVGKGIYKGATHAFLLKGLPTAAMVIDLGTLSGGDLSVAFGLNSADEVVGYSTSTKPGFHGFVWKGGMMTDIGTLPPYTDSYAQAINEKGCVVGDIFVGEHKPIFEGGDFGAKSHAVLYTGVLIDLNTLIPTASGWELKTANDINDKCQVVGAGHYKGSKYLTAYVLTPPGVALTGAPKPTPTTTASSCPISIGSGDYIFNNWNVCPVKNSPTKDTTFTLDGAYLITFIATYHWNYGHGALPGGKGISLKSSDGKVYGPWPVTTTPGSGGASNVNWECHPGVVIPAGTYSVIDPDPATWSQNDGSGNKGFVRVAGSKKG